jgi:hypothetical protein
MKVYGKQYVLFENEPTCAWPMQEVILKSMLLKYLHYVTTYIKNEWNTIPMYLLHFFN